VIELLKDQGGMDYLHNCCNGRVLAGHLQAVMTLDMGCPVGDAAWAPYSATVFAAACEDGRLQVHLFSQETLMLTHHLYSDVPAVLIMKISTAHEVLVTNGVQVYDLAQNKVEALSKQKIVANAALTRLAFNMRHPILLVGDDM
jgi:dynein intermediate chain 1